MTVKILALDIRGITAHLYKSVGTQPKSVWETIIGGEDTVKRIKQINEKITIVLVNTDMLQDSKEILEELDIQPKLTLKGEITTQLTKILKHYDINKNELIFLGTDDDVREAKKQFPSIIPNTAHLAISLQRGLNDILDKIKHLPAKKTDDQEQTTAETAPVSNLNDNLGSSVSSDTELLAEFDNIDITDEVSEDNQKGSTVEAPKPVLHPQDEEQTPTPEKLSEIGSKPNPTSDGVDKTNEVLFPGFQNSDTELQEIEPLPELELEPATEPEPDNIDKTAEELDPLKSAFNPQPLAKTLGSGLPDSPKSAAKSPSEIEPQVKLPPDIVDADELNSAPKSPLRKKQNSKQLQTEQKNGSQAIDQSPTSSHFALKTLCALAAVSALAMLIGLIIISLPISLPMLAPIIAAGSMATLGASGTIAAYLIGGSVLAAGALGVSASAVGGLKQRFFSSSPSEPAETLPPKTPLWPRQ